MRRKTGGDVSEGGPVAGLEVTMGEVRGRGRQLGRKMQ